MAAPGEGYRAHFTGLYHGRDGLPTKDPARIDELQRRLHAKLATPRARAEIGKVERFLLEDAERVVVAFGITARAAKDAVIAARREGIRAGLLRPLTLWPAPEEALLAMLAAARRVVVAELNLGQYLLEVERLAYHAARAGAVPPPEVVAVQRVDMGLITPAQILEELRK